jgi:hypothetical protein
MTPLLRYWLFPGRLRRLPKAARIALAVVFVLIIVAVCIGTLRVKLQTFAYGGPLMIPAMVFLYGLPSALSVLATVAGATLIAGERQNQTWEPLLLSPMPVWRLVILKLFARLAFCVLISLPPSVCFISVVTVLVRENTMSNFGAEPTHRIFAVRTTLFLTWTFLQVIGHLPPFLALGAAVSARCRKVNDALLWCMAILAAYGVLLWQLNTIRHGLLLAETINCGLGTVLLRWPVLPYLSAEFPTRTMLLPSGWKTNLVADLIWIVAVTCAFTLLAITWSRLSRRSRTVRKLHATGKPTV